MTVSVGDGYDVDDDVDVRWWCRRARARAAVRYGRSTTTTAVQQRHDMVVVVVRCR